MSTGDGVFGNIREILGPLIGRTVLDITQADPEEGESYVMLHFDDGSYLKFPITDLGFHHNVGEDEEETL